MNHTHIQTKLYVPKGTDTSTPVDGLKQVRLIEHYRSETAYGKIKDEWVLLRGSGGEGSGQVHLVIELIGEQEEEAISFLSLVDLNN